MEDQLEILDSDDEPLKDNHDNDNIYVDSEDEALAQALTASRTSTAIEIQDEDEEEGTGEDAGTRTGWGECPMCTEVILQNLAEWLKASQLFRLPELQLHAMACQGVGLNGGEGGNMVNPMDVSVFCFLWK